MMQVYLLSVLTMVVVGLLLVFEAQTADIKYFENPKVKLFIGFGAAIVGVLKLIVVVKVPVVGDLIPALAGMAGGVTFILEYYIKNSTVEIKEDSILQKIFIVNKKTIGIVCLAAAALHFVFPAVLFL